MPVNVCYCYGWLHTLVTVVDDLYLCTHVTVVEGLYLYTYVTAVNDWYI